MGWEWRGRRLVYYRKERDGRRVRSIYCGPGERGERAAREDEERRLLRGKAPATVAPDTPEKPTTRHRHSPGVEEWLSRLTPAARRGFEERVESSPGLLRG